MHLSSMTGFARQKADFVFQNKKYNWVWEIKSVNAKNADVKIRLPQWLDVLETDVKNICMRVFSRGTFNINLMLEVENTNQALRIDEGLLTALIGEAHKIYDAERAFFAKPSPVELLKINGVIKAAESAPDDEETAALGKVLCQSFETAAAALKEARQREGEKSGQALQMILAQIRENVSEVRKISEKAPEKIKEKICRQIQDMAGEAGISEERDRSAAPAPGGKECTDLAYIRKLSVPGRLYPGSGYESVSLRMLSGYEKMHMHACADPHVPEQDQPAFPGPDRSVRGSAPGGVQASCR